MRFPIMQRCAQLLLLCLAMVSAAFADQIILKNGDRVTGSIVKKDGGAITVKTDQFGVTVTPWDQVESIAGDKPLFVVLKNGQTVQGTLTRNGDNAEIKTAQSTNSVLAADIVAIRNEDEEKAYQRLQHPGWQDLWTGTATIGIAGTSGNSETFTFTANFNTDRTTRTDKTAIYFNAIKSSARINDQSEDTAKAIRAGLSYDHNAGKRFFYSVFNDYEYDRFKDLDLRFSIGGGFGYHAVVTKRSSLDLLAGMAYSHSSFSSAPSRDSAEFYWGDQFSFKVSSAMTLTQSYRMFNDLTNTGDYRVNFDVWLDTKIWKWLTWKVALSDRYLSNPVPGSKANDLVYTTGVGVSFGK